MSSLIKFTALVFRTDAIKHLSHVAPNNPNAARLTLLAELGLKNIPSTCVSLGRLQSLTGDQETFLKMQASFLEAVFPRLLNQPSPLSRDQLIMLEERTVGEVEIARQLFKLSPVMFRDGIASYLR